MSRIFKISVLFCLLVLSPLSVLADKSARGASGTNAAGTTETLSSDETDATSSGQNDSLIRYFEKSLRTLKTPADSLKVFYDIYDLSSVERQRQLALPLYKLAERANNYKARLNFLRYYVYLNGGNDSLQAIGEHLASKLPESPDKRELMSYIRLKRIQTGINTGHNEIDRAQVRQINSLLERYANTNPSDILQRTEMMFAICMYLNNKASGSMLESKLKELQILIDKLPQNDGVIPVLFYNFIVTARMNIGENKDVIIKACEKYLALLDSIEKKHHAEGRKYLSLDLARYHVYEKMLGHYGYLTPQQIETYYARIQQIAARDKRAALELEEYGRPHIFYHMAKGEYAMAMPLLKRIIDRPEILKKWQILLPMYIEAARSTADKDAELHGLELYNNLLNYRINDKAIDIANELQILYDSNDLRYENDNLLAQNQKIAEESRRWWMLFIGIIAACLAIGVIIIGIAYARARRTADKLLAANDSICAERDSITSLHKTITHANERADVVDRKKKDLLANISHDIVQLTDSIVSFSQLVTDSVPADKRERLDEYIHVVSDNAQILQSLVNDLVDSADFEQARITLVINNFSLSAAVDICVATIQTKLNRDVRVNIRNLTPDISPMIDSDPKRVEQILFNLLSNAAKFTIKGHIDIEYGIDRQAGNATIAVSDTGIGIPADKTEIIFNRFEKLNSSTQGIGLGLYVCRTMAGLIGGEVKVDSSYRDGARFVFTFPIDKIPEKNVRPSDDKFERQ